MFGIKNRLKRTVTKLALEALNIRILLGESKASIEGAIPVSYGSIESTPSNRKGERMPSISACQVTQPGHSIPPGSGLPHRGQMGGVMADSVLRHDGQSKLPSLPQPRHRCGNKKPSAILLSFTT